MSRKQAQTAVPPSAQAVAAELRPGPGPDPGTAVWALISAGQMQEAQPLCASLLAEGARSAHLLHAAGVLALQRQDPAAAREALEQATQLEPRNARLHYLLGRSRRANDDLAGAIRSYEAAVALEARFWEAWVSLGIAQRAAGRIEDAIRSHERATSLEPRALEAHLNLANALFANSQSERAVEAYRAALSINSAHPGALRGLMITHALCFLEAQRWDDARLALERARERYPEAPIVHVALGVTLWNLGELAAAHAALQTALSLAPEDLAATMHIAGLLGQRGLWRESLPWYEKLLARQPEDVMAMSGYAGSLINLARFDEAVALLERAIALAPDFGMARYNRALLYFLDEDYRAGYPGYEFRFLPGIIWPQGRPDLQAPAWQGEPLAGRHLLVWAEQGIGDTVQYARYLRPIAERVRREEARLTVVVHDAIAGLLQASLPELAILSDQDERAQPPDLECPIMSLPLRLGMEEDFVTGALPLLSCSAEARAHWRERLPAGPRRRIGLVWGGNPEQARNHIRSVPLAELLPLLDLDADFHVLQKGAALAELDALAATGDVRAARLLRTSDDFADFMDTAAAMEQLDLVITVDTSVAHLAATLGRPTWILLAKMPDWRYGQQGERCRWYPDVPLFRQSTDGDWTTVIGRVRAALAEHLAAAHGDRA